LPIPFLVAFFELRLGISKFGSEPRFVFLKLFNPALEVVWLLLGLHLLVDKGIEHHLLWKDRKLLVVEQKVWSLWEAKRSCILSGNILALK
jgi:hypothetical protein